MADGDGWSVPVVVPLPDDETGEHMRRGCDHPAFDATVDVNRLVESSRFIAELQIRCAVCGTLFRVLGAPVGIRFDRPHTGLDPTLLNVPIVPLRAGETLIAVPEGGEG